MSSCLHHYVSQTTMRRNNICTGKQYKDLSFNSVPQTGKNTHTHTEHMNFEPYKLIGI